MRSSSSARLRLPPHLPVTLAGLALAASLVLGFADLAVARGQHALDRGDAAGAERLARLAASLAPWDHQAHALSGQALLALGEPEAAAARLQRARALGDQQPDDAGAYGQALQAAGHYRQAAAAFRSMVQLWPWQLSVYEHALAQETRLIRRLEQQGDPALAAAVRRCAGAILADLDRQKAKEPPGMPRRPLAVNSPLVAEARSLVGAVDGAPGCAGLDH